MQDRSCKILLIFCFLVNFCLGGQLDLERASSCTNVQKHYQLKGLNISISDIAIEGKHLRVCRSSYSCCTEITLDQFNDVTPIKLQNDVNRLTVSMKSAFNKKHKKFNDFFGQLIVKARNALDDMFSNTYGDLYSLNSAVFMKLFTELRAFYSGSMLEMDEIFDSFFSEVMLKVFELMHPAYVFDDVYKECIADNMDVIKPFAGTPDALERQFRRSFVQARTFVRGLQAGKALAANVAKFNPSPRCVEALVEMSHCAACRGGVEVKPCPPLCKGVVRGCLGEYRALTRVWEDYIGVSGAGSNDASSEMKMQTSDGNAPLQPTGTDGMQQLLDRLNGHFNIEAVLETFEVKLSEAVMMLQENEDEIEAAVFRECGFPKKRNISSNGFGPFDGLMGADASLDDLDPSYLQSGPYGSHGAKNKPIRDRRSTDKQENPRRERRGGHGSSRGHRGGQVRKDKDVKKTNDFSMTHGHRNLLPRPNIEQTRYQYNEADDQLEKSNTLASLVGAMKRTLDLYEEYWEELPHKLCVDVAQQDNSAICWNGTSVDNRDITGVDDESKQSDAEVAISSSHVNPSSMAAHVKAVRLVVTQLKQGSKGVDPHRPPSDDDDASYSGDGSGMDIDSALDDPIIKANDEFDVEVELSDTDDSEEKPPQQQCATCDASSIATCWLLVGLTTLLTLCSVSV